MIYKRDLEETLIRIAKFPVVAILGPRQSGKTTLSKRHFKNHTFVSFEDPETREFAVSDPKRFLKYYDNEYGIIIDEFQYVPQFLSYIQLEVDAKQRPGYFILTGSQNFLMNQAITQSLAGRVGILTLLPFSCNELAESGLLNAQVNTQIFKGGYPRIYQENIDPNDMYPSYIQTYIEKDVRHITNVGDLNIFQRFIGLCAGRIGQLLNISDIATNCGISVPTATRWLSVLESSYIIFLLQPHFNNFNKRLTKSPKLFFYDTGIACNLLKIISPDALDLSPYRGNIFENFIMADFYKQFFNAGKRPSLYFWRDQNGRMEVDCIVDAGTQLFPIEIKSAETMAPQFFDTLLEWDEISGTMAHDNYVVYAGRDDQVRAKGNLISWQSAGILIEKLYKKFSKT